ncbi:hypothetical protein CC2G_003991 [Coprinopsis cinerea AmutBmut pab1-1]|nr:hypothetical protein CC2G_003991 [Coprinopsis cinerea AmutBmut pab1-1]
MPGPGSRKSKSKKPKSTASQRAAAAAAQYAYVHDVDDADGWTPIVNILCGVFQLPDLTTRRGLKKVHQNFDEIYNKLESAYQANLHHEKIKGGIVGIYTKMCTDSILRNKLYQRGLLDKLIPLVSLDSTRRMALRALVTFTHHGGSEIRAKIATHASVLTSILINYPSDALLCEMAVSVLAHSIGAVTEGPENACASPKILAKIDMPTILKQVVKATKTHHTHRVLFEHAVELIACSTLHASSAFYKAPEAIRFLVAGVRCRDWVTRCLCLTGLIRLHKAKSEDDQRFLDPNRLIAAISRGTPDHISDVLMDYGPTRSELYLSLSCTRDFQKALMDVAQTHDLHALGMTLARLILTTEFSIADGYFESINPKTGAREAIDVGLPFSRYSEALPHCASALRSSKTHKGLPRTPTQHELDCADILEIKYHIMKANIPKACSVAQTALKRNPDNAYFYYAISLSADHTQGLRASKKGIKCKTITPFIKWQLTQRAVEHAGDFGLHVIQGIPTAGGDGGQVPPAAVIAGASGGNVGSRECKWEEGIAFLMSAYEDAKSFLNGAPPDNRYMKNVSYWYILLTILIADKISPDLRELKEGINKLAFADECSKFMGITPPKTMLRLTQETAIKLLPNAMVEFKEVFDRRPSSPPPSDTLALPSSQQDHADSGVADDTQSPVTQEKDYQDDLSAWLDRLDMEDSEDPSTSEYSIPHETTNAKVRMDRVSLYRCSWCGNPSAALQKCSGCQKARYCDSTCQKSHWPDHKKPCKAAVAQARAATSASST